LLPLKIQIMSGKGQKRLLSDDPNDTSVGCVAWVLSFKQHTNSCESGNLETHFHDFLNPALWDEWSALHSTSFTTSLWQIWRSISPRDVTKEPSWPDLKVSLKKPHFLDSCCPKSPVLAQLARHSGSHRLDKWWHYIWNEVSYRKRQDMNRRFSAIVLIILRFASPCIIIQFN